MSLKHKLFLLIATIIVIYTLFLVTVLVPKVEHDVTALEEKNAKTILNEVVMVAEKSGTELEAFRREALEDYKRELTDIVDVVQTMFQAVNRQITAEGKEKEYLKNRLLTLMEQVRYNRGNYVFAIDYNETILAHPYIARGTYMRHIKDIYGKPIVPELLKVTLENGEGFIRYWWKRSPRDPEPSEKLTYCRNCVDWSMIVCTGVYIDDIRHEVEKRKAALMRYLRKTVNETKIGNNGYLYIFDEKGILIHPNKDLEGMDIRALPNPEKGTPIYLDLIEAAKKNGVLYYKWDKPDDRNHFVYDKVSWVRYVPSMGFYVASSVYLDDIRSISATLCYDIYVMAGVLLIVILLLSGYIIRRILSPVTKLDIAAKKIAEGDLNVRTHVRSGDELERLSKSFNMMVDKLQTHIRNLDKLVSEKTKALEKTAITDALSGLYNRRYFNETAHKFLSLGRRRREPFSVLMIDIDNFKRINDTYGHLKGDEVIRMLAHVIKEEIRDSDIACRYGGEEFVVLMPNTTLKGAYEVAERIRRHVERLRMDAGHIRFTVSIGVAEVRFGEDITIDAVVKRADDALYDAKQTGKNRVVVSK